MRPRGLGRGLGALLPTAARDWGVPPAVDDATPVAPRGQSVRTATAATAATDHQGAEVRTEDPDTDVAEEEPGTGPTAEADVMVSSIGRIVPVEPIEVAPSVEPSPWGTPGPAVGPTVVAPVTTPHVATVVPPASSDASRTAVLTRPGGFPARSTAGTTGVSGQVAAALAARLPDPGSDVVRAVDRWLWRDVDPVLPEVPDRPVGSGALPATLRSVGVPRGTPNEPEPEPEPESDAAPTPAVEALAAADDSRAVDRADAPDACEVVEADRTVAEDGSDDADGRDDVDGPADPTGGPDGEPDRRAEVSAAGGAVFAQLAAASIVPNPRQPRQVFDEDGLAELAASIREVGLLQPVVVRPAGDHYELVMGERRWRASQLAGLALVPAIIKPTGDDVLLRDALLENIQRVQLNPLEEAAAYGQLLEDFGCTQDELATRLGKSRPQVTNTLRLLRLTPPVQRRIAAGVLSAGHAKALLGLADPVAQELLAGRVVAEGLSVRTLEELVSAGTPAGASRRGGRPRVATAGSSPAVAARLSDHLETRVTVSSSRGRGRLVIEFAGDDDLSRIADLIDPVRAEPSAP